MSETARSPHEENHLVILRASRLESLVPPLMQALATHRPEDVLAPQTVIAAHPGMKQWLTGAMAREAGPGGIVANIDVLLPGAWLGAVATQHLGDPALALPAWQRSVLRWSVFEALHPDHAIAGLTDARIARYLAATQTQNAAEQARRRFQLADRLAAVFTQYLVYRSDWLRAWESGLDRFATAAIDDPAAAALEHDLLAPLWRHLVAHLGPHRAEVIEQLIRSVDQHPEATTPLHVFGFSHLPPGEQQVLRAWARHAPVFLYLPDPCREYWGGLVPVRAGQVDLQPLRDWQAAESRRIDAAAGGDWLDDTQSHPLLARWGRLGQHFYASLADWEALADIRDHQDVASHAPQDRLSRVQSSIRGLNRDAMRESLSFPLLDDAWRTHRADASLRVHACHTRLRELEVLRDALLDAIAAGIEPGRIVVMAPDISAYAPLLPAIFGQPGDASERRLPWHLADASLIRRHRLFALLARLLELGSSRITTPEVLDLLTVPEIARALDLQPSAQAALRDWLAASRAAWGLDATHRHSVGVPATRTHTQAWAVDRMVAGYLMTDEDSGEISEQTLRLPDGEVLLPITGIHGPDSAALAALDRLLGELQRWRDLIDSSHPASEWAALLDTRLGALLDIDPQDPDAQAAWRSLRSLIAQLASEPAQTGADPVLHFAIVHELLSAALDAVPEHQRFLMGGITFCGMVPQRAIPFDMVCVLGLDDGDFPRRRRDGGIDLMARLRRVGDRDARSDDRWLFLETLMSARQRLHLSWLGRGARDGQPRNPAAPLAELLSELDHAAGISDPGAAGVFDRPWLIEHPLQPFDARYFSNDDPALFSYSAAFAGMRGEGDGSAQAFLDGSPLPADPLPQPIPLSALARYWKQPAQELLQRRLKLDLAAEDEDALPDSEPLDARFEHLDNIARRVFFQHALPTGFDADGKPRWEGKPPAWLTEGGYLPPGDLAGAAWAPEAQAINALLSAAQAQCLPATRPQSVEVNLTLPAITASEVMQLRGTVPSVFADGGGWQIVHALPRPSLDDKPALKSGDSLDIGQRLALFIQWAALRLHMAEVEPAPAVRLTVLASDAPALVTRLAAWDAAFIDQPALRTAMRAELEQRLSDLIALWWQASATPPIYFPASAQAALAASAATGADDHSIRQAIRQRFEGGWSTGERDYGAGWNRLLARGIDFDAVEGNPPAWKALLSHAEALEALLPLRDWAAAGDAA